MTDIIPLSPQMAAFDGAVDCYCDVWRDGPGGYGDRSTAANVFERHASYPGYRGYVAVDDRIVGYAYGYESRPGQYYHDALRDSLPDDVGERWLRDCFEFVELGVAEHVRRRGIGTRLHDTLLEGVPQRRSILTTGVENEPAQHLYGKRGWRIIHAPFSLEGSRDMVVMGLKLADDEDDE